MSTVQITGLPIAAFIDGSELIELQKAGGGAGSSESSLFGAILTPDYITGLALQWVSATAVTVSSGSAYISSLGRVLRVPTAIAVSGLSLTASTMYHVYLYLNGTTPSVEIVTTAPSAPYFGSACRKTGDTSRRYLGSLITDGSSNVIGFVHSGTHMYYTVSQRILSAGTATSSTQVSAAAVVPPTATIGKFQFQLTAGGATATLYFAPGNITASSTNKIAGLFAVSSAIGAESADVPLDTSQRIAYIGSGSGFNAYADVIGYLFGR